MALCICEHKGTDQQQCNSTAYRAADQSLCYCNIVQSLYFLNQEFKPLVIFCACTARFVSDLVEIHKDIYSHVQFKLLCPYYRYSSLPNGKPFTNAGLRKDLEEMVEAYKKRAPNLQGLGSTQANESFNHMVACKALKNK